MLEFLLLFAILAGLTHRRGEPWEATGARAKRAVHRCADWIGIGLEKAKAALPSLTSCCLQDVRAFVQDMIEHAPPRTQHRIVSRLERLSLLSAPAAGPAVAPATGPAEALQVQRGPGAREKLASALRGAGADAGIDGAGTPAWRRLQRRYLDGRITLDQYVREAERLRGEPT
jgi:hypothetical protein